VKESLKPGISLTNRIEVDAPRTIEFMGEELRVYATPELIRDIEITCRDLILQHADDKEDSVGTHVSISHTGATPLGAWVEITATVAAVEGRLVTFEVTARDPIEEVGKGKHSRFVVDVDMLRGKLADKKAKLANG
jgi:predicted thioesterase